MSEPLFFCADLGSDDVVLEDEEARHMTGSRRLRTGDAVSLFDGRGTIAHAVVGGIDPRGRRVELRVEARVTQAQPAPALHLACALPKGDRQTVLLDMATQLGMTAFTPLVCARSIARPGAGGQARWQRICLEACKQSRRAHLPAIHSPAAPEEVVAGARGAVWIAHPGGGAIAELAGARDADLTILVGPEGGFTGEEIARATAGGAVAVGLGEGILRIETAAIALLAAART